MCARSLTNKIQIKVVVKGTWRWFSEITKSAWAPSVNLITEDHNKRLKSWSAPANVYISRRAAASHMTVRAEIFSSSLLSRINDAANSQHPLNDRFTSLLQFIHDDQCNTHPIPAVIPPFSSVTTRRKVNPRYITVRYLLYSTVHRPAWTERWIKYSKILQNGSKWTYRWEILPPMRALVMNNNRYYRWIRCDAGCRGDDGAEGWRWSLEERRKVIWCNITRR